MTFEADGDGPSPVSVSLRTDNGSSLLLVAGKVDLASVGALRDGIDQALSRQLPRLIIDLAGVGFLDSTGLSALLDAHRQALGGGTTFLAINCQPPVHRIMAAAGVRTLLTGLA